MTPYEDLVLCASSRSLASRLAEIRRSAERIVLVAPHGPAAHALRPADRYVEWIAHVRLSRAALWAYVPEVFESRWRRVHLVGPAERVDGLARAFDAARAVATEEGSFYWGPWRPARRITIGLLLASAAAPRRARLRAAVRSATARLLRRTLTIVGNRLSGPGGA